MYRLFIAICLLLMFASFFGVIAAFINASIGQLIISMAFFALSTFALSGVQDEKTNKHGNVTRREPDSKKTIGSAPFII